MNMVLAYFSKALEIKFGHTIHVLEIKKSNNVGQ